MAFNHSTNVSDFFCVVATAPKLPRSSSKHYFNALLIAIMTGNIDILHARNTFNHTTNQYSKHSSQHSIKNSNYMLFCQCSNHTIDINVYLYHMQQYFDNMIKICLITKHYIGRTSCSKAYGKFIKFKTLGYDNLIDKSI